MKNLIIALPVILLLILGASIFVVEQRQVAIVFQFGEAVRVLQNPGLHFKVPMVQQVAYFDNRILNVDVEAKELTALDGKRIIVDAFARFKIIDAVRFYRTVYNYQGIQVRLNRILESSMRKVIGKISLIHLLSGERAHIMKQICDSLNSESQGFGISVIDVRIARADLPQENSAAIYRSMQEERVKEAMSIRAEGSEISERIKAEADMHARVILADAYMHAQSLKGEGEAKAAEIYNQAYSQDPEFYKFSQYLKTYRETLKKDNTYFILSPDTNFFKFLNFTK